MSVKTPPGSRRAQPCGSGRSQLLQAAPRFLPSLPPLPSLQPVAAKPWAQGQALQRPVALGAHRGHVAIRWPAQSYPVTLTRSHCPSWWGPRPQQNQVCPSEWSQGGRRALTLRQSSSWDPASTCLPGGQARGRLQLTLGWPLHVTVQGTQSWGGLCGRDRGGPTLWPAIPTGPGSPEPQPRSQRGPGEGAEEGTLTAGPLKGRGRPT